MQVCSGANANRGASVVAKVTELARRRRRYPPWCSLLEPVIANRKQDAGVQAGIECAEARVRVMHELNLNIPRALRPREDVETKRSLRREIHIRGIPGGHILRSEQDATRN